MSVKDLRQHIFLMNFRTKCTTFVCPLPPLSPLVFCSLLQFLDSAWSVDTVWSDEVLTQINWNTKTFKFWLGKQTVLLWGCYCYDQGPVCLVLVRWNSGYNPWFTSPSSTLILFGETVSLLDDAWGLGSILLGVYNCRHNCLGWLF